jgi:predicted acyltransferase
MPAQASGRIPSIDQYRGYAIFGMILVNFLGEFKVMPWTFKHHHAGMSYADTIAPIFMFVVGIGFRLSFQRRIECAGIWRARWEAAKRYLVLIGVGIVVYGPLEYRVDWWDALVDIGFAGLLALPFVEKGTVTRVAAAIAYLALYQLLYSLTGYGEWTMERSIDGGPLGPLSWVSMLLFGTICYDIVKAGPPKRVITHCLYWGLALALLGFALKVEWPGIKAEWPFSQRGMTAPYPLYSTGLAFLTFIPFYVLADIWGRRIPHLSVLGENALVIYIVQALLMDVHGSIVPEDSSVAMALLAFAGIYLACYAVAWKLHKDGIIVKL